MPDKNSLRKELLGRRDAIPPEVRRTKSRLIREKILSLDEFVSASRIFFFASFRSEVDTFEMIRDALSLGKRIALPRVERETRTLVLYEIKGVHELSAGYMGIPEPSLAAGERPVDIRDVDAVLIPGAAFDPSGNRIGYGGGYYDRLLGDLNRDVPVIAPAFEEQIVESVPVEPHDRKVDIIVTDRRIIRCR